MVVCCDVLNSDVVSCGVARVLLVMWSPLVCNATA